VELFHNEILTRFEYDDPTSLNRNKIKLSDALFVGCHTECMEIQSVFISEYKMNGSGSNSKYSN